MSPKLYFFFLTLSESLNLIKPLFLYLQNRDDRSTSLGLGELNGTWRYVQILASAWSRARAPLILVIIIVVVVVVIAD